MWFTIVSSPWRVGRITPDGGIAIFQTTLNDIPVGIAAGPDGNLWIAGDGIVNGGLGTIGVMTPAGSFTQYRLPTPTGRIGGAEDIAVGPDGNLWFTWVEMDASEARPYDANIGMITPSGDITKFPVSSDHGWPRMHIVAGSDGNMWFTQPGGDLVGSISVTGTIATHSTPSPGSFPNDIARASGDLWFTESGTYQIARLRIKP
jgi:virginiamycin B lyase